MTYRIIYYGTGMTPLASYLPEDTTEEHAIQIAQVFREDPYMGFSCLEETRRIEVPK